MHTIPVMEFIRPAGAYTISILYRHTSERKKINYLSIMHTIPVMEFISPAGAYTMSILYGPTSEKEIPLFINNAYISRYGIYQSRRGLIQCLSSMGLLVKVNFGLYNIYPL